MKKRYLLLADGTELEGCAFGAAADISGEIVFTTGVVGYVETLSDPANAGKIVVQTFPQIGCSGVCPADVKSDYRPAGYVVRDFSSAPCNFRSEGDVEAFLCDSGVVGICGIDTRALTRHIREAGEMRAVICDNIERGRAIFAEAAVPCAMHIAPRREIPAAGAQKFRVTVIDFGSADEIIPALCAHGCAVTAVPACEAAEAILADAPDGVILTDGAGDPAAYAETAAAAAKLLGKIPLFGWGLGHLVLAAAAGARTEKMHVGHRGGCPVRDKVNGRVYLTAQNHGWVVCTDSLTAGTLRYENVTDGSCEGIDYPAERAFSVQFCPILAGAAADRELIIERFISLIGGEH